MPAAANAGVKSAVASTHIAHTSCYSRSTNWSTYTTAKACSFSLAFGNDASGDFLQRPHCRDAATRHVVSESPPIIGGGRHGAARSRRRITYSLARRDRRQRRGILVDFRRPHVYPHRPLQGRAEARQQGEVKIIGAARKNARDGKGDQGEPQAKCRIAVGAQLGVRGGALPHDARGLKTEKQSRAIKNERRKSALSGDLGKRVMRLMPGGGVLLLLGILGVGDREHSRPDSH